jgi:glutathione synthase/RimK-type ligase-like ATP-grasp enzyme
VAIHNRRSLFVERWFDQAPRYGLEPRLVDGYSTDIITEIGECRALLWHLSQDSTHDLEFGRHVLRAAETLGLVTFPNEATCAHFDDKVAQASQLRALGAPAPETWVFFSSDEAMAWAERAEYPVVFKLRRGAGSANVRLVRSEREARRLVRRMFGAGMTPVPSVAQRVRQERRNRGILPSGAKTVAAAIRFSRTHIRQYRQSPRERGYVLFQRFLEGNDFDTRVTIIGDRAFTFRRRVRPGDFRASGSGVIEHLAPATVDQTLLRTCFDLSHRGAFQAMAYDFVNDRETDRQCLLEISYVFNPDAVHACAGFFDGGHVWHEGHYWPQDLILQDVATALGA